MRKYICDNCGAEFDRLETWEDDSDYAKESLWQIHFSRASDSSKIFMPFKEVCSVCREKLEKIIRSGF